jgi:hypothetical protein
MGIPDLAQRCATEIGSPKKSAICCQPFSTRDSFFCLGMEHSFSAQHLSMLKPISGLQAITIYNTVDEQC